MVKYDVGTDIDKAFKVINDRHQYLLGRATPEAYVAAMNATMAQSRTKVIRYIKNRVKVPSWIIARKMPRKLQRKASLRDLKRGNRVQAKNHLIASDVQAVHILSKRPTKDATPRPDESKMKSLKNSRKGVSLGKAGKFPNAFVADGSKRQNDPKYDAYVRNKYGAGNKVLKGKHWQVLERTEKSAYPVKPVTIPIKENAYRSMKVFTNRVWKNKGVSIFLSKQKFMMEKKVTI